MNYTTIKISISIFFLLLILYCKDQTLAYKPKNLIDELTMENIIYEAIMMDVMSTFKPKNKKFIGIVGSPYLLLKYNIDSLQLVRSNEYYIKNPKVMGRIYTNVLRRMERSKDSIDNIKIKEN
tara:strand:+ start:207 stop:575 length:369 start_codon:yes stop_codon:yes gene_type:complete